MANHGTAVFGFLSGPVGVFSKRKAVSALVQMVPPLRVCVLVMQLCVLWSIPADCCFV